MLVDPEVAKPAFSFKLVPLEASEDTVLLAVVVLIVLLLVYALITSFILPCLILVLVQGVILILKCYF